MNLWNKAVNQSWKVIRFFVKKKNYHHTNTNDLPFLSSLKDKIANLESENEVLRNQPTSIEQVAALERVPPQVKVH